MARSDVLVTADWAESNLDTPGVVFVEVDEDASAYDTGHIAGAVKLDWHTELNDPVTRDYVDGAGFAAFFARIRENRRAPRELAMLREIDPHLLADIGFEDVKCRIEILDFIFVILIIID